MISPKEIYQKVCDGDHLTYEQLEFGAKHFGTIGAQLMVSGPTFSLAAVECIRVSDKLASYVEARKQDDLELDRLSKAYIEAYQIGLTWDADWQPGGPHVFRAKETSNETFKVIAEESRIAHRRWMLGFKEGNAVNPNKPIIHHRLGRRG